MIETGSTPYAAERLSRLLPLAFDLSGRHALVTGGAMSIGAAIARALASAGADVSIHTSRAADAAAGLDGAADSIEAELAAMGGRTCVVDADLAETGAGSTTVRSAEAMLGPVEILVICASVQSRMPFQGMEAASLNRQIDVNLRSTIGLLQAALPTMVARGWGRVLSIGSINALRPEEELAVYAALKAAQHNLIANLARTHAATGVTLNTLSPGLVATERNRWRREDADDWKAIQAQANPMRRAGTPEEMAGPALLLCSDAGRFITGVDLSVSGGAQL